MSFARSAFALTARAATRSAVSAAPRRSIASAPVGEEFINERKHAAEHAGKSADLWRKISLYVCIPGAAVMAVYIYGIEAAHIHHRDHEIHENGGELPERVMYEYNNIRKRSFPWGQQSLFFNQKANYPSEEM
ncbi:unnamed protein product [Tilletia controversa]|uniref:Cytochrome c oxidase subunit n=2 Tax=Tilletia TaxID=13289 RepID=A0A177UUF3_9BASI|nr:hypothetical protein CF336_g4277 [Tilletia laevis]KAE8265273.1 hypothetical protein A4X03_0g366 [Tilletia caries]CAD6896461.1 unnamed protein product [Tilletia controversa]KAE8204953.1 hypothetical protein CF335_g2477 [Tilletia laevis]CAD6893609.1 unnamed protein product [Tilletia caries]